MDMVHDTPTIELDRETMVGPADPGQVEVQAFDDDPNDPNEEHDTFDEDDFDDEFDDDFDELYDDDLDEGEVAPEELDDEAEEPEIDFRGSGGDE